MKNLLLTALIIMPGLAQAEVTTMSMVYTCDNQTEVPATYVNSADSAVVVLTIEGAQVALTTQQAASGAKYAPASGTEGYIWWEHQGEVTLAMQGKTEADEKAIATCTEKK